jgi:SAM-dependent methyltransferase
MTALDLRRKFYPESAVGGFSHADMTVVFYARINAIIRPTDRVLDFGAGRGAQIEEDSIPYRRAMKILRGRVAKVDACDLDPEVMNNPFVDEARLIEHPSAPLPYEDETFDVIFSSWVFEHVDDPAATAQELLRILKPGGCICAMTPNKWGYVAMASRLAGNKRHVSLLKYIQPARKHFDVFPTRYKLNTESDLKKYFGSMADIYCYQASGEPAYHFNNGIIYGLTKFAHRVLPGPFQSTLFAFIRKFG